MAAIIVVVAAALAWTTPTTHVSLAERAYIVEYTFDYSDATDSGGAASERNPNDAADAVYGGDGVRFGVPLFASIVDEIEVAVEFDVATPNVRVDDGDIELAVMLESSAGWVHPLAETAVRFASSGTETSIVVDFGTAREEAARIDSLTQTSGSNKVVIVAATGFRGHIDNGSSTGRPLDHSSRGVLEFELTSTGASLQGGRRPAGPASLDGLAPGTVTASTDTMGDPDDGADVSPAAVDRGVQVVPTMAIHEISEPNRVSLWVASFDVGVVRYVLAGLSVLLVMAAARSLVVGFRSRRAGEGPWLLARHGGLLPVGSAFAVPSSPLDLGSFRALQVMGAAVEQPIMFDDRASAGWIDFYVVDGANVFCYSAAARLPTGPDPVDEPDEVTEDLERDAPWSEDA